MKIKELKELIKDIPDDTRVMVDTEARRFNVHKVDCTGIQCLFDYEPVESEYADTAILCLDTSASEWKAPKALVYKQQLDVAVEYLESIAGIPHWSANPAQIALKKIKELDT